MAVSSKTLVESKYRDIIQVNVPPGVEFVRCLLTVTPALAEDTEFVRCLPPVTPGVGVSASLSDAGARASRDTSMSGMGAARTETATCVRKEIVASNGMINICVI